jgi:hypothetical protein
MRRFLRSLTLVFGAFLFFGAAGLVAFDRVWLLPRLGQLQSSIDSGAPEERNLPPAARKMVLASTSGNLTVPVVRILASQDPTPPTTLRRHASEWLAAQLVPLRWSEEQMLAAYATRVYVGGSSYGLQAAALELFGLPLSSLSAEQAASVAALPHSPNLLRSNPERLSQHAKRIIERSGGGI